MDFRVADQIVDALARLEITDVFTVTGGAAMHLNDAFGAHPSIACHYMHHEQACAMAAEGYGRIEWKPAAVCVTAGPGALNALNGVFGAFTDSVPMFVVSGQSRSDMLLTSTGVPGQLRQMGDQEASVVPMVKHITKAAMQLGHSDDVNQVVSELFETAVSGRPGPVWLEVPVDVQGKKITREDQAIADAGQIDIALPEEAVFVRIHDALIRASRPVIIAGTGVRAAGVEGDLVRLAETLNVPVATAWTHDVFPNQHRLYAGRPGTIGTRAGNFAVQAADVILILGSRLNIRQVSYNWDEFAKRAELIHVDIDQAELDKPYLSSRQGTKIQADLRNFLPSFADYCEAVVDDEQNRRERAHWNDWIASNRQRLEPKWADYTRTESGINPYHFFMGLNTLLTGEEVVVCGDATACIVPFQVLELHGHMRLFSNSGCASMGYDLPAALGAAIATPGRRVICFAGDGSLMMNIQELETLRAWNVDLKLFVLNNNGYLSIKQTQANFFGRSYGTSPDSALTFPDFARVAEGFQLPTMTLQAGDEWDIQLARILAEPGPHVVVVDLDENQEFEPRIKSRMTPNGIETPPLDDMYPHLDSGILDMIRTSALSTRDFSDRGSQ